MRKFLGTLFICIVVLFFAGCFFGITGLMTDLNMKEAKVSEPSILFLRLEGVILDGEEFLSQLKKYSKQEDIKGILVQVNSPGGVVGPSQEIYREIQRVREELKKPVVMSCLGMAASGAYYAAVGADKIVVNPGSLMGSIGVIMEFANLEKLYDWAKIQRYVIKTGNYKDSGAEYREMRDDERQLFQAMADEVLEQFRKAVAEGRKLSPAVVEKYSDGRVFTGATAVALGFADSVGTLEDAKRIVGQLSGLGEDPKLFTPPPKRPEFLEEFFASRALKNEWDVISHLAKVKLLGQPLFLMPGVFR